MEISNSCRCCLMRPSEKKLKKPYTRSGKTEVYSNMLKECFEIHLTSLPSDEDCGICGVCEGRLRDASDFKLQVQHCQDVLQAQLKRTCCVKEEESPKAEKSDNYDAVSEDIQVPVNVKTELSDPLPTEEIEEFKSFMSDFDNQAGVCKQEPFLEGPIKEQTLFPFFMSPRSCIGEAFDHHMKPKKKRKKRSRAECKNEPYICGTCGRQFTREVGLNIHKQTHKRGPLTCEICNKQFKWRSRLDRHKLIHIADKPYACDKCKKLFSDRFTLNKHKRTHSVEKPFACDICNARYIKKLNLVLHMGVHTRLPIYRCKKCPVKVADINSLRKHVRKNHASESSYVCDECKRVFHYKGELMKHMNVHFKWISYPCELCGMKLSTKNSLRRHKLVHTGERAYSCEMCNKSFRYKHSLNAHLLTHTGEKPHCCEICGKQFAQKNNLKTHLEIHVEGRIYACQLCTKSYSTAEGLRQHRRTHTKNKSQAKSVSKTKKQNDK